MPLLDTDRELTRHSYYAATAPRTQGFAALQGDAGACDVAIVGGGLAGLSAAIEPGVCLALSTLAPSTVAHADSRHRTAQDKNRVFIDAPW